MPARPTCPFCGASVSTEARYCDRCGTPLTTTSASAIPARQLQGPRRVGVWFFVLSLVLVFSAGTIGGFRYTAGHWPFSQPAVARLAMDETEATAIDPAAREYLRSVVSVNVRGVAGNRAGSGFVIDTAGHVVTAAHVVEGAVGCVTVFDDNGRSHLGTVVGRNPNLDVALIRVPTLSAWPEHLELGTSANLKPDEALYALGSPKGAGSMVPLKAHVGKVGGSRTIDGRYFANLIQFDGATVQEGASGGPLVQQSSGKVVGVVAAAGSGSVAWAVPVDDVVAQIKQWAITPVASCSPGESMQTIPVVLAAITPQSGSYGVEGTDLADGMQLAIRDMEPALEGVGYSVSLKTYDDQGSPERGREMASTAAYDPNVVGVVGSLESTVTFAVAETLAQSGLVIIAPTASADELLSQKWAHFNRLVAGSRQQEQAAARFAQDRLKARAVYLIQEGTVEANRQATSFQAAAQVISLPVVGNTTLHTGWDYAVIKNALLDAKADAVYYAGGADTGFRLVQELRQDGFLIPVLGGEALYDPRFEHLVGPGARGVYFTRLTAKPAEPFQRRFETVMGKPTRGYAAYGYDAASVILTALVRYGEQNPARLPNRMDLARLVRETRGYSGWSSWVTFGASGENLSSWVYLFEWKQGMLEPRINLR